MTNADPSPDSLISLAGYTIAEPLYWGTRTAVYRATRNTDGNPVTVKVMRGESLCFGDRVGFRNHYAIARPLDIPGIIKPLSLEPVGRGYALVMEDWSGIPLGQYLQGRPLGINKGLTIARQLTNILHDLHHQRIVHKDIKPDNILIDPRSQQIKVSDFSIASLLPKEIQQLQSPNGLEGTLAYLAPEQTGRMNRGIDYRTDFYALGITLYQLWSGRLPFEVDDPLEAIYCHIAKTPEPLDRLNPKIPGVLAAIVAKLMAKNAEDRYQSARGIEFDLAQCAAQWRETGAMGEFALGARDLRDRFSIPEKLYGRGAEVQALLDAFGRVAQGQAELMLVAGFSGIGKTAVVNEIHKPIAQQGGYFIKGKFGQFNRDIPLSAFVSAFRDLMANLLSEPDAQLDHWRAAILAAVGQSGEILIDVIPELERIIGPQPSVPKLTGNAAQNRFNQLFPKFVRVFARADRPLVIFLDDLQWADAASLVLMRLLIETGQNLLIVGAYRDNEVFPVHPTMQAVDQLERAGETVRTLVLAPLSLDHTTQLVADTLHCSAHLARPLAELVDHKTHGNPFFTNQFLKALHEEGQITFNRDRRHWECDIAAIQRLALTDDVAEFMALQLRKLPQTTQQLVQLAAYVGSQFDLETLAIVAERSPMETSALLWPALQEGSILPIGQTYKFFQGSEALEETDEGANPVYRFLHDRVQQAAYTQSEDREKPALHLRIGRLLQRELTDDEQEERLFDIVGHLNLGREAIAEAAERNALAAKNLAAAHKAKQSTAYDAAQRFAQIGIELLGGDRWESQYDLSLALQTILTEAHCLGGNVAKTKTCGDVGLTHAKAAVHRAPIYIAQMNALTAQDRMAEAIAVGMQALQELGVVLAAHPTEADIGDALQALDRELQGRAIDTLADLPRLTDPAIAAAMTLFATVLTPVVVVQPALFPLVCAKIVSLSLAFGNHPVSTVGYVGYGVVLVNAQHAVKRGYRFGKLALNLLDRLDAEGYRALVLLYFSVFLQHRQEPISATIPLLENAFRVGMETGDFLNAGYSIKDCLYNRLFAGQCLTEWSPEPEQYIQLMVQVNHESPIERIAADQQTVCHWTTSTDSPDRLKGEFYDETQMLPYYRERQDAMGLAMTYIAKLKLAYVFQKGDRALDHLNNAQQYIASVAGFLHEFAFSFYAGLTYLRVAGKQLAVKRALDLAAPHQQTLSRWAQDAPMNYQHQWELLEAERLRVLGRRYEAGDYYDRAIAGASGQGFIQNAAIANERAAQFYLDWGRSTVAAGYMQAAYESYDRWGAQAKIIALQQTYPQWFSQSRNALQLQATDGGDRLLFDFPTVMQAVQTISQEIEPDKLLARLVQLAMANAGATRVSLAIQRNSQWTLVACADVASGDDPSQPAVERCDRPLDTVDSVPRSVINTVIHSEQLAVFDDLSRESGFAADPYIIAHRPKSALCLPLHRQGKTLGILYLENNLTVGAFVGDRVDVLQILAGQAAIALENARLYQEIANYSQALQAEVERQTQALNHKTQDLEQTLLDLRHAQVQLVQQEKMSALGQLVGGIAHEINNPVTFIQSNIYHAKASVDSLLELLALYESHYPEPVPEIEEAIAEADLPFLREDLQKIFQSMRFGSDRISQIVKQLRNFSRLDESTRKAVDLHTGLDSTLLLLGDRCQPTDHRPAITIIKNYGNLPKVMCYARELNQVFLSVLDNAIDAINQLNTTKRAKRKPQIFIETSATSMRGDRYALIKISDTGRGIPAPQRSRIFEPFFTTKPVGSGTGLGLSVSYAIVQRHGGELSCEQFRTGGTTFTIAIPLAI